MPDLSPELSLVLEVTSPQGQNTRYELTTSPLVIGRLPECDIQLDTQRVSRRHAQLVRDEIGQWAICDLASRNGTRVNGVPVTEQVIGSDDLIEIGRFQLRILWPDGQREFQDTTQTTLWSVEDPDATDFRKLSSAPAPRLNASHLAKVNALNQRLLDISDSRQRLIELCRTLIARDMSCNCAVALRIVRGAGRRRSYCVHTSFAPASNSRRGFPGPSSRPSSSTSSPSSPGGRSPAD